MVRKDFPIRTTVRPARHDSLIPRWVWLAVAVVVLGSLGAGRAFAASSCDICGGALTNTFYSVTDKFRDQKRMICGECVKLPRVCFVCGVPVKTNYTALEDGRILCSQDADTAVMDEEQAKAVCRQTREELDRLFSRYMSFPATNVTIGAVDRVHLEQMFKRAGRDHDCPNVLGYLQTRTNWNRVSHWLSVLSGLPVAELRATSAHEFGHAWMNQNLSEARKAALARDANEGFCELLAYMLMSAQNEELEKQMILRNAYTRGQIHLFIEAEERYGFNDVLDWLRYGNDSELSADEPTRLRRVQTPMASRASGLALTPGARVAARPESLMLKGVFLSSRRAQALINGRTFAVNEEGRVTVGSSNVMIKCLVIEETAVKVRIEGTGEERELRMGDVAR